MVSKVRIKREGTKRPTQPKPTPKPKPKPTTRKSAIRGGQQ